VIAIILAHMALGGRRGAEVSILVDCSVLVASETSSVVLPAELAGVAVVVTTDLGAGFAVVVPTVLSVVVCVSGGQPEQHSIWYAS